LACSEIVVASLMIKPALARCASYSAISGLGSRSAPARARVIGAITTRLANGKSFNV
jgi:hypothetical protein